MKNREIRTLYKKRGKNEIPPFKVEDLSHKYYALFMYDKTANNWVHWFAYDIKKD